MSDPAKQFFIVITGPLKEAFDSREEWTRAYALRAQELRAPDGLKPPPSWILIQQEVENREPHVAISIWHRRYTLDRKLAIWFNSTDDDFRRAGYLEEV